MDRYEFERKVEMSIAVVYYSANGNSALAAKALSEKLGARLIELKEAKPRKLDKVGAAFMKAGMQAAFRFRSKLQGQPWRTLPIAPTYISSLRYGHPGKYRR